MGKAIFVLDSPLIANCSKNEVFDRGDIIDSQTAYEPAPSADAGHVACKLQNATCACSDR